MSVNDLIEELKNEGHVIYMLTKDLETYKDTDVKDLPKLGK